MNNSSKRRDGFEGERLISIPEKILHEIVSKDPALFRLYISHIGYFPKASYHYRERRKGCEDNIFLYCLQGKGYCVLDNKRITLTANQFIIIPSTDRYIRYWADNNDPWTLYWIHYTGADIKLMNQSLNIALSDGPVDIAFNQKALDIWENIYENLSMGFTKENFCNASFCLHHFLATFIYPQKHRVKIKEEQADPISTIIEHMRSNLQQRLSVEEMASMLKLSSSHFTNLFRKATGMPPVDYFINLKMQQACLLLNTSDFRIKKVAETLGYEDQYYFSRVFKKCMGVSPEQYKKNIMQG